MIISELYFLKKSERTIAKVITILFISVVIIGTVLFVLFFPDMSESNKIIFGAIVVIGSSISILDICQILKNNMSIGFFIIHFLKYKRKHAKPIIIEPSCNIIQKNACEGLHNDGASLIHIYGYPERGKTTTALFMLEGLFLYDKKRASKICKILFVDCSIDPSRILDEFEGKNRIQKFENSIVILDHIEQMGSSFIKFNEELFQNRDNLFILVEDTLKGNSLVENYLPVDKRHDFNENIVEKYATPNLNRINKWDTLTQEIFFCIYFAIQLLQYPSKSYICNVLDVNLKNVNKSLKKIANIKIFLEFPFNNDYIYCVNASAQKKIPQLHADNISYKTVSDKCQRSNCVLPDGKWLCFIQDSIEKIQLTNSKTRLKLFNDAVKTGRFSMLYQALDNSVNISAEKKRVFAYEYGVLSFYMGEHKKAFGLFDDYLHTLSLEMQDYAKLRIVEAAHGSSDNDVMKLLNGYLAELVQRDSEISLYAQYWEQHIRTEKGIFETEELEHLCNTLTFSSRVQNSQLHTEIIKRCYTDILRCYHSLGNSPSPMLIDKFKVFLQSSTKEMYQYYNNLYIQANGLHYVTIPLTSGTDILEEDLSKLITRARKCYISALESDYSDQKSKLAVRVKLAELEALRADTDISTVKQIVNNFLLHADVNNVDVHVAFSKTLLAKLQMINNQETLYTTGCLLPKRIRTEIDDYLSDAHRIYKEYGNEYGMFRTKFLGIICTLYAEKEDLDKVIKKLEKLVKNNCHFKRELTMAKDIKAHQQKNGNLSKQYLSWLIRSYPIILQ